MPYRSKTSQLDRTAIWLVLAIGLAGTVGGCRSAGYVPSELPDSLLAETKASINELHLAGFAPSGLDSDLIGVDDLLEVTVNSGYESNGDDSHVLRVSSDGSVLVPIVGKVPVAGIKATEASQRITAAAQQRGLYRQPQVTVVINEKATYRVIVLGAVQSPGTHELPRGVCDVVSVVAAAGGLTEEADPEVEVLRRSRAPHVTSVDDNASVQLATFQPPTGPGSPAPHIERINLSRPETVEASKRRLGDRDVVLVRPREADVIHVTGLVKTPDQFELPPGKEIRLLDAIALAGGRTTPIADRVTIIRQNRETGGAAVIAVSVAAAKKSGVDNLVLAPGDLVSVEPSAATVAVDAVKSFFRVSVGVTGRVLAF